MAGAHFKAGYRDRRMTFERVKADATVDAAGDVDLSNAANWETYCERWVGMIARTDREFWRADQVDANVTHLFVVLWDSVTRRLTTAMRGRIGARVFELTAVVDVEEAHRLLQLTAMERVS